jgi:hypothetical protein
MTSHKIYHLHPLVAGLLTEWLGQFDRIQGMGFDTVCLAPPFVPGDNCDIFVTHNHEFLHPVCAGTATPNPASPGSHNPRRSAG